MGITVENILNDSIVLSNESMPKPELTQRRRRLEERMDQRKIDNEIDYLKELSDQAQH
tara:strand:+ start:240 stop:413 length:174 start_codon:yes stop_codon:yes gene_type:complete